MLSWTHSHQSILLKDCNLNILYSLFFFGIIATNLQEQAVSRIQLVLVVHLSAEPSIMGDKTGSPPVRQAQVDLKPSGIVGLRWFGEKGIYMAMVSSRSTGSFNSIAWGHIFVVSLVKSKHANKAIAIRNDKRRTTVCGPIYCFPFLGPDTFAYDYFSQ